jgi:hypothetical protein
MSQRLSKFLSRRKVLRLLIKVISADSDAFPNKKNAQFQKIPLRALQAVRPK